MFKVLGVVLVFIALGLAAPQPHRPNIDPTCEAYIKVEIRNVTTNETLYADGVWHVDFHAGKALEYYWVKDNHTENVYRLQRYDLGYAYEIVEKQSCVAAHVNGTLPDEWAWVKQATYQGKKTFNHETLDLWGLTVGYATVELAVRENDPHRPVWLGRKTPQKEIGIHFAEYHSKTPDPHWFTVPKECNATKTEVKGLVGCLSRSTITDRAQSWVNAHVPYNQGATYGGYREDCSGFVSMSWETAQPGYTTYTLHDVSHPIAKSQLQPGDCLLCASEHVVLFGGWADGSQTEYIAYEETRPGEGTVKRVTPYPYWYNTGCFIPYSYNSAC